MWVYSLYQKNHMTGEDTRWIPSVAFTLCQVNITPDCQKLMNIFEDSKLVEVKNIFENKRAQIVFGKYLIHGVCN